MPFEYTPYRSPYVGAIADLIGQRGDIEAKRALQQAAVKANTLGAISQGLTTSVQQMQAAKDERLKRELLSTQVQAAQQRLADRAEEKAAGAMLGQLTSPTYVEGFQPEGALPDGSVLPKTPSLVTTVGGIKQLNKQAIAEAMSQAGHGAWFLQHGNSVDDLNKSAQELHQFKTQALQKAAQMYLLVPDAAKQPAALSLVDMLGDAIDPAQAASLKEQINQGNLEGINALAQQHRPFVSPTRVAVAQGGVNVAVDPLTGKTIAGTEIAGAPRPETDAQRRERIDAARVAVDAGTATPEQAEAVKRDNAHIAANRAPQRMTAEDAALNTIARELGYKSFNDAPGAVQRQALSSVAQSKIVRPVPTNRFSPQDIGDVKGRFNRETGNFETQDETGAWRVQANAPLATTGTVRTRQITAATVGGHFDRAKELLAQANAKGLLGPIQGRYADFEAGKIGSTGNPENDQLLGELRLYLSLARSGVAQLHGRGGANVGIVQGIEKKMDESKMSYDALMGALNGMQDWVDAYAKPSASSSLSPATNTPPPGSEVLVYNPKTRKLEKQ